MSHPGYFTTWSAGWLVVALLVSKLDKCFLTAAAINSIVVGLIGPYVVAYGRIPGNASLITLSNAWMHALPMFVAALILRRVLPSCRKRVLGYLVVFDLLWLLARDEGCSGWKKAKRLYGIRNPCWVAAVVAAQFGSILLFA
tara:strand:- start:2473 stop:2898 length:426 start_codon:yes stop_codon:yes gene_type:complete